MIRFCSFVYDLQFLTDGIFLFSFVLTIDLFSTLRKVFPFEVFFLVEVVYFCGCILLNVGMQYRTTSSCGLQIMILYTQ